MAASDLPTPTGPYSGLTIRSAKRFLQKQFESADIEFAEEDALDLVLGLTGLSRTEYVLRGNDFISSDQLDALRKAGERRLAGTPVDRILGWREFYGRRFNIDNVLSPRGDTEVLLLAALNAIRPIPKPHILDLGTGSGALAISILCETEAGTAVATDLSEAALKTAQHNADALHVSDRLTLIQSDWFAAVPDTSFDAVLSNPPYITTRAMGDLDPEVASHDPEVALHGGEDGLSPYRVIISQAVRFLSPGGWLGVEIGYDQGTDVRKLFESAGYSNVSILQDPAGHDRVVCAFLEPKG